MTHRTHRFEVNTQAQERRSPALSFARHWLLVTVLATVLMGPVLTSAGCGGLVDAGPTVGGETHFLVTCNGYCAPGLSCIDGACTRTCTSDSPSCSNLSGVAECAFATASDGSGAERGVCEARCNSDLDCAPLGDDYSCNAGVCRAAPPMVDSARQSALGSRSAALVQNVEPDVCDSQLRWMGGETPHAEMLPGSDCVGCHQETGAMPLVLGGTIYATLPRDEEGGLSNPLEDCLGQEGVEVRVVDGLGREWTTVTNRSGNFWFEGNAEQFPFPYQVGLFHVRSDGAVNAPTMITTPSYGGCARCHGTSAPYTDELSIEVPEFVLPQPAIFLPGLVP